MNIDDLQKSAAKKINIEELLALNSEVLYEIQRKIKSLHEALILKTEEDYIDYFQKKNFDVLRQRESLSASFGDIRISLSVLKRNSNFVQFGLTIIFSHRKDFFVFLGPEKKDFHIPFLAPFVNVAGVDFDQLKSIEKKLLEEHLKLRSIKDELDDLKFEYRFIESENFEDELKLKGYKNIMEVLDSIDIAK
jgi:hypothetical protein